MWSRHCGLMDPSDIIKSAGGVLLTRDVLSRGATDSGIRAAIRCGDVVRVERGLLAVSGADPELVAKMERGADSLLETLARGSLRRPQPDRPGFASSGQ